jgi:hypothetical protein
MADQSWDAEEIERTLFARKFLAERQEEADYLGLSLYDYMSQVDGGILSGVMYKLKLHAEDHPFVCPPDCVFVASLERLKRKYKGTDNSLD